MLRNYHLPLVLLPLALCAVATAQRTPDEALRALQEGNRRFAEDRSVPQPIGPGVRQTLARGQSPYAVIVSCADSRVPPEHIFNTGLGELVIVRSAGHVLGSEAIATIEHAVERLNVPLCVILGHEHCDVIETAIRQTNSSSQHERLSPAVAHLLERIEPAVRKARAIELGGSQLQTASEEEHAQNTAAECMRRSPLLRRFASVGKFRMVAARYQFDGTVEFLPQRPLQPHDEEERPAMLGSIPTGLPPHVALRMLRAGHNRFLGDARPAHDLTASRRTELASNQEPMAIVVTDSDSRVSPEHIFDAGIGELFVIRTAGNTMTSETLASIEFAASRLGTSLLIVMGHSRCDPILAASDDPENRQLTPHQRQLLRTLEPSVAKARTQQNGKNLVTRATQNNVLRTINEARSQSLMLRSLEDQGRFSMLACYYDVASGDVTWLKTDSTTEVAQHVTEDGADTHQHTATHAPDEPSHEAAPHGETAPVHSEEVHQHAPKPHDNHTASTTAHEIPAHLSMPSAPASESQAPKAGVQEDAHGDSHVAPHGDFYTELPADLHGALDEAPHEKAHQDDDHAHPHTEGHEAASHQDASEDHSSNSKWNYLLNHAKDPIVIVGMTGIASLLAAALLLLRPRS